MNSDQVKDPTKTMAYKAKRVAMYAGGKESAIITGEAVQSALEGGVLPEAVKNISFFGLAIAPASAAIVAVLALASAVSAGLTQMDFLHKKKNLAKDYREEIASQFDKPLKKVSDRDIDTLSHSNGVISEQMSKNTKQRNWGVLFSVLATSASLAAVLLVVDPALAGSVIGTAKSTLMRFAGMAIKGTVGVLTYNVVKQPLHFLGEKLFDLERETAHERIMTLHCDREAGRQITREQVAGIFAAARPDIDRMIVSAYGDRYEDLTLVQKKQAADDVALAAPVDRLTDEIQQNKVNVTELAWAVQNEASGVQHDASQSVPRRQPGLVSMMLGKIRGAFAHKEGFVRIDQQVVAAPKGGMATAVVSFENEVPSRSMVQQLRLTPVTAGKTQLERLEQRAQRPRDAFPPPPSP